MKLDPRRLAGLSPEQRQEVEPLLEQLQVAHAQNPLWAYHPHPSQKKYHEARTPIKGFFGGNRSGKTTAGLVDDLIQCVDLDALPDHLKSYKKWGLEGEPVKLRIVAPKFNESIEQVIFPEIRRWCPRTQLKGGGFDKAFSKSTRILYFENGSTIQFLTFEQDLDAHAGAALHRVHFDEEPDGERGERLYIENSMRLADYGGDFCMTMTPLFGLSWSYDEIWQKRWTDRVTVVQVDSFENPHVDHESLKEKFERMTVEEREARQKGNFVHLAGMFYPEFGDKHVVDPPPKEQIHDPEQTIVVGIDPGLTRTGVVWVAFDGENDAVVFAEFYPKDMEVVDVAKNIHLMNRKLGIDPDYTVIDPSARNRSTINKEQIEGAYSRAGVHTIRGDNSREAGILEIKRRFQHGGLVISRNCVHLINELQHYRRDPNSADEWAAVKKNDHLCDALRYVCLGRAWGSPGLASEPEEVRWEPGTAPPAEWFAQAGPPSSPPLGAMT